MTSEDIKHQLIIIIFIHTNKKIFFYHGLLVTYLFKLLPENVHVFHCLLEIRILFNCLCFDEIISLVIIAKNLSQLLIKYKRLIIGFLFLEMGPVHYTFYFIIISVQFWDKATWGEFTHSC